MNIVASLNAVGEKLSEVFDRTLGAPPESAARKNQDAGTMHFPPSLKNDPNPNPNMATPARDGTWPGQNPMERPVVLRPQPDMFEHDPFPPESARRSLANQIGLAMGLDDSKTFDELSKTWKSLHGQIDRLSNFAAVEHFNKLHERYEQTAANEHEKMFDLPRIPNTSDELKLEFAAKRKPLIRRTIITADEAYTLLKPYADQFCIAASTIAEEVADQESGLCEKFGLPPQTWTVSRVIRQIVYLTRKEFSLKSINGTDPSAYAKHLFRD